MKFLDVISSEKWLIGHIVETAINDILIDESGHIQQSRSPNCGLNKDFRSEH